MKVDVTRAERICLPAIGKQIIHPYSDQASFANGIFQCYSLEEVVAEKIRAIGGQRRFAISRDLYDIYNLLTYGIDMDSVKQILPEKFDSRGLSLKKVDAGIFEQRRFEFEKDWERRLNYLVTRNDMGFDAVWQRVLQLLKEITVGT